MEQKSLILIGGGGHCKACIDVVEAGNQYKIVGILDHPDLKGSYILGYQIIGSDDDIQIYKALGCHFLVTVGQIKSTVIRTEIIKRLEQHTATVATIISPNAYVSKHAIIGRGTVVMHGVNVNAGVQIGENCILNTNCNIEHDTVVGSNTHISTHAVVNGGCNIGNEVFIGSNATVLNQIVVTDNTIIGATALVRENIKSAGTYAGNPLMKIC